MPEPDRRALTIFFVGSWGSRADQTMSAQWQAISNKLAGVADVQLAVLPQPQARSAVTEVAATISAVVLLLGNAKDLIAAVRAIVEEARGLVKSLGLDDGQVPIRGERKSLYALGDEDVRWLAANLPKDAS